MDLLLGAAAKGLQAVAAGADTASTMLNLTGRSPQDELAVALSGGFRHAVETLQALSSQLPVSPLLAVQCKPLQISGHLEALEFLPEQAAENRLILYFHGGAHCCASASTHAELMCRLSLATRARVVAVNYRMAPQHPFPAGLEDALSSLRWAREKYPLSRVAIAGDSAGGNLAFALLVKLAQLQAEQPVACIGLSPWLLLDLAKVATVRSEHRGVASSVWGGEVLAAVGRIAANRDLRGTSGAFMSGKLHDVVAAQYFQDHPASDPLISPMLASEDIVRHFPPVLLHADRDEPLVADSREMAALCSRAGVPVQLELYSKTAHVFQLLPGIYKEAAEDSMVKVASFLESVWPSRSQTYSKEELSALSVRELRAILEARGLSSEGCCEKQDLVECILGSG